MSHWCPDCGLTCYCGGDIDDCCFSNPVNVLACQHCEKDDGNDEYDPEEEEE